GILQALASGRRAEYAVRAPGKKIVECLQENPAAGLQTGEVLPAADSSGVTLEAFRTVGLSPAQSEPFWLVPTNFSRLVAELPSPRVHVPEAVHSGELDRIAAACDAFLGSIDSIRINEKLDTEIEVPVMELPAPSEALYRKSFRE
ncbi:MAG: hypothetical protein ACI3ZC_09950, partial [Candidatus Cryptobacteroides sp.]